MEGGGVKSGWLGEGEERRAGEDRSGNSDRDKETEADTFREL